MSNEKRKPNWTLCVNDERNPTAKPRWRSIGAAWETQSGNWFVKVDEGQVLQGVAMLFPYREKQPSRYAVRTWKRESPQPPAPPEPAPYAPPPPAASEPDYMDRKRAERSNPPQPPLAQPPSDDLPYDEGVEPPWL